MNELNEEYREWHMHLWANCIYGQMDITKAMRKRIWTFTTAHFWLSSSCGHARASELASKIQQPMVAIMAWMPAILLWDCIKAFPWASSCKLNKGYEILRCTSTTEETRKEALKNSSRTGGHKLSTVNLLWHTTWHCLKKEGKRSREAVKVWT